MATKKKSPARKKSPVKPAMKAFMAGKKTGGKRKSPYSASKKEPAKKYVPPGGLVGKAAGAMKKRHQRMKKI
jgi:hypothetical protein